MPLACLGGGTGRRAGLKIRFRKECRFDSDPRHQLYLADPVKAFKYKVSAMQCSIAT